MVFYALLLNLAGAIALLLWAVRMVRTGVERSYEPALRRFLVGSRTGGLKAAATGAAIALFLQSSTAVAVLTAGFAASGFLTLTTGLALMLGADLGSALVVQVLSLQLDWMVPIFLVLGTTLFFRGIKRETRQLGRIAIGIALILLSLRLISEGTDPLRHSEFLPDVIAYLRGDFVTAFLIGAAFTWLAHSSVATILLVATFVGQGVVPFELGMSLVLGANLGGGLIAVGLTRQSPIAARRISIGNLAFRGIGAIAALLALRYLSFDLTFLGTDPIRQLVNAHLVFNLVLVILCLPLTGLAARLIERLVPDITPPEDVETLDPAGSCLDQEVIKSPALALASATRELLRMAELVERMLKPLMEIYETGDTDRMRQVKRLQTVVAEAQREVKLYLARIKYESEAEVDRGQQLSNFAINLENIGDITSRTLLRLAKERQGQGLTFSPEGWRELTELHHRVMTNMQLALNVLVSQDRESARQLLGEKDEMRDAERNSYGKHLHRLRSGSVNSIETSDIHLETVRALKTVNSLFAGVAYPILANAGELLDSRLANQNRPVP